MAKREVIVKIEAVIEYEDTVFDIDDIDNSVVICFRKEDKYAGFHTDEELFLPKMDSMEVIQYLDINIINP